jgi:hypothetical protein
VTLPPDLDELSAAALKELVIRLLGEAAALNETTPLLGHGWWLWRGRAEARSLI